MADTIQRVEYFYAQAPNKAGEGARFLTALQEAGINLLAFPKDVALSSTSFPPIPPRSSSSRGRPSGSSPAPSAPSW
jgi:hypothetical protein